jgi:hypothetical protein
MYRILNAAVVIMCHALDLDLEPAAILAQVGTLARDIAKSVEAQFAP